MSSKVNRYAGLTKKPACRIPFSKGDWKMLESLKRIFNKSKVETLKTEKQVSEHDVLVATCALFVEMARIDEKFTPAEVDTILSILKEKYGLSQEHADALLAEADKELEESLDLWQFASLINENYSVDEKIEIIETLWQMVFVDGKMDRYEHYLMNKLKNLLRLSQDQLINAKLKVLYPK
jgi:uncharacterized tellurite resistance protein B-like protein